MNKPFQIVKPNNSGKGTILQFSLALEKYSDENKNPTRCVFLNAANQKADTKVENAKFDYDNKIVMKLGFMDLGKMINVFNGKKQKEIILHKFEKNGVTTTTKIEFSEQQNKEKYSGYFMQVGKKAGDDTVNMAIGVSDEEAACLKVLLEDAICRIYWEE